MKSSLLVLMLFFSSTLNAQVAGGEMHRGDPDADSVAAIYGTVRDIIDLPVTGAYLLVTDEQVEKLYGETLSISKPGPDDGSYQITSLPADTGLLVFAFHEKVPGMMALKKIRLQRNEYRKLNLDIRGDITDPGMISMSGGAGGLTARLITVLSRAQQFTAASARISHLKSMQGMTQAAEADRQVLVELSREAAKRWPWVNYQDFKGGKDWSQYCDPGFEEIAKGHGFAYTPYLRKLYFKERAEVRSGWDRFYSSYNESPAFLDEVGAISVEIDDRNRATVTVDCHRTASWGTFHNLLTLSFLKTTEGWKCYCFEAVDLD